MADNEKLRGALEVYLEQKRAKLEEVRQLDLIISRLSRDLGEATHEPQAEQEESDPGDAGSSEVWGDNGFGLASSRPASKANVRPDAFFGMSYTTAAAAYLESVGHAVSMDELLDALNKGGSPVGGKEPKKTLYISLVRAVKTFVPIPGRSGFLGLRKFYPNLKAVKDGVDATAKAKKKKAKKKKKAGRKGNGAKVPPELKATAPTAHSPSSAKTKDHPEAEAVRKGGAEK
jgi:hypothetical protein